MNNKKTIYYIIFGFIFLNGLIIYFVLLPLSNKTRESLNSLAAKINKVSELSEKKRQLEKLSGKFEQIQPKIDMILSTLPKNKELSEYIIQLENSINNNGSKVKSIKINQAKATKQSKSNITQLTKKDSVYELSMEINIDSPSYSNLLLLTKNLENFSRFTSIKKMVIKHDERTNLLSNVLSLNIYVTL